MSAAPLTGGGLPAARRRGWSLLIVGMFASTLVLAIAGVVLAVGIIGAGEPAPASARDELPFSPEGPFGTSQDIPTSFGVVAVPYVDKAAGATDKELGGRVHGISSHVPANKVKVQVAVTFTNLLDRELAYSPTQFRLLVGRDRKPVKSVKSSIDPGTLQPTASIDANLSFVAPRTGSQLMLEFRDPGSAKPIIIDLGKTGKTPESAFDKFRHGGSHG